jgi:hypothetical protein
MMTIEPVEQRGEETIFLVADDQPRLRIGLQPCSLLARKVYIWLEILAPLGRGHLRQLQREFASTFAGTRVVCNVSAFDSRALRFAEAFGFALQSRIHNTLVLEKDLT